MVLDTSLFYTQQYKVRIKVKWSNLGKGVVLFPTPWCSSYWKGSLLVALNYGRQLYLLLFIYLLLLFLLYYYISYWSLKCDFSMVINCWQSESLVEMLNIILPLDSKTDIFCLLYVVIFYLFIYTCLYVTFIILPSESITFYLYNLHNYFWMLSFFFFFFFFFFFIIIMFCLKYATMADRRICREVMGNNSETRSEIISL